jgi:hypothetical protein
MNELISLPFSPSSCWGQGDAAPAELHAESIGVDELDFASLLDRNRSSVSQLEAVDNASSACIPFNGGPPLLPESCQSPTSIATSSLSEEGGAREMLLPDFEPVGPEAGNARGILFHPIAGSDLVRWIGGTSIAPLQSTTAMSTVPAMNDEIEDAAGENQTDEPAVVMGLLTPPPAQAIMKPMEPPVVKADTVASIELPTVSAGIASGSSSPGAVSSDALAVDQAEDLTSFSAVSQDRVPFSDAPAQMKFSGLEQTGEARAPIEKPEHAEATSGESISSLPWQAKSSERVDREPPVSQDLVAKSVKRIEAQSTFIPEASNSSPTEPKEFRTHQQQQSIGTIEVQPPANAEREIRFAAPAPQEEALATTLNGAPQRAMSQETIPRSEDFGKIPAPNERLTLSPEVKVTQYAFQPSLTLNANHHEAASTTMRSGESLPPPFATTEQAAPVTKMKSGAGMQEALDVWKPAFSQSIANDSEMTEALSMKALRIEAGQRVLAEFDRTLVAARITQPLAVAPAGTEVATPRTAATFRALLAASASAGHDELNGDASSETIEPLAPSSVLSQTGALTPREKAVQERGVASDANGQKRTDLKELGLSPNPFAPLEEYDQTFGANELQFVRSEASPESSVTYIKVESKRPAESGTHDAVNALEISAPIANGMQIARPLTSHDDANREAFQQAADPIVAASEQLAPNEAKTLRLTLRPKEMGEVEVEIRCDAAGRISAHLSVEREQTGRALNHGIVQLRDALELAGLDVGQLDVSAQSRDAGFGNAGQSGSGQSGSAWTAGSQSGQFGTPRNIYAPALDELELESTRNGGSKTAQDRLLNLHA